jgi:hypothetical protein
MKEKTKNLILHTIAGSLFLVLVSAIIFYTKSRLFEGLLWVCYPAITLMIIGILLKKPTLILSQLILITVQDLFWIFDFFNILFTGNSPLEVASYFFEAGFSLKKIITLQHLFTVPLGILALSILKVKKDKKVFIIALIELSLVFLLGFFPIMSGINCLPTSLSCTSFKFPAPPRYFIVWWIFVTISALISYFVLINLPFLKEKTPQKSI